MAWATMQSPRLFVRIIHQLYAIPAMSPTSQYGPCSDANNAAVIQNAPAAYAPSATFSNSGFMSQRIIQPRQNNSSTIGTMRAARNARKMSTIQDERR